MTQTPQPFADRFWSAPDGLRLHARDYAGAAGGNTGITIASGVLGTGSKLVLS